MKNLLRSLIFYFAAISLASAQIEVTFKVDITEYLLEYELSNDGIKFMSNNEQLGGYQVNCSNINMLCDMENIPNTNVWKITFLFPDSSIGQALHYLFANGNMPFNEGFQGSIIVEQGCGIIGSSGNILERIFIIPNNNYEVCYFWDTCIPCTSLNDYNRIQGNVFLDLNSNQIKDEEEPNVDNSMVKVYENGNLINTIITGLQGNYMIPASQGEKTVTVEMTEQYTSLSSSQNINFPSAYGDIEIVNFPLELSSSYQDLEIIALLNWMVAGYEETATIKVKNNGNIANNLTLSIQIPENFTVNNTTSSATINGNDLTWNISQIEELASQSFNINYTIAPPPTYMPGDFVEWSGNVTVVDNETNILNNVFNYSLPILSSYDPNDKTMMRGQSLTPAQANNGNPFIYRIRFQNNGNFPAQFIHVRDTLELGLDANTIRTLDASHDCSLNITEGRYLDWFFPNIQLPDSLSDPEGSQGYILFSVMPVLPLNLGDSIHNTAHIYFDFNPAVVTNKEVTKIELPSQIKNHDKWELQAFYNVMSDKISIKGLTSEVSEVRLISVSGQLIHFWNKDFDNMKVNQINSGIYIVHIMSKGESKAVRLMINR